MLASRQFMGTFPTRDAAEKEAIEGLLYLESQYPQFKDRLDVQFEQGEEGISLFLCKL